MNDSFKMFVVALVTAVATQLLLGPYILKLQGFEPASESAPASSAPAAPTAKNAAKAEAKLTAPNVEGMSVDDARAQWRAKDIAIIEVGVRTDSGAKPGTILSQRPPPGEALDSRELRVTVAQGAEASQVPDVVGKPLAEARAELVDAGFEVPQPTVRELGDDTPEGQVIEMKPNAGAQAAAGSVVRLTVAKAKVVPVPKVTGSYLGKAEKLLEEAGLKLGSVRRVEHAERGQGYVLKQDPAPGTNAAPGSEVTLVVVAPD